MDELENKYIDLILNRCLAFHTNSLLIDCDFKEHVVFANKVKEKANKLGIDDVYVHCNDLDDIHTYLQETSIDDITLCPLIDRSPWDEYSKKGASLLFLTSTVPGLMNDIAPEKIQKWIKEREKTTPYYRQNVSKYVFPWTIVALPNQRWADLVFPNDSDSYEKLYLNILKMCMVDRENPIEAWNEYIKQNNFYNNELNRLQISKLYYRNSLGTDFSIGLPEGNVWVNLDQSDSNKNNVLVNMPSYEIFTSPDYRTANGIVYSSRPLFYNDARIEDFSITYKDGSAVSCEARVGEEILKKLIFENKNANYLGEIALVSYDSPISKTGIVFNETLFDENASCHLAIGGGFPICFQNYDNLVEEELIAKGLNISDVHVDFMIGTADLEIEADTKDGKKLIFKNGNFNL